MYLAGTNFTVITDHQPLTGILNGKNLDAMSNVRIHRIVSKMIGYQFRLLWTPGKVNHIADALSRCPVFKPEPEDDQDVLACSVVLARSATLTTQEEATEDKIDPAIKRLIRYAKEDHE